MRQGRGRRPARNSLPRAGGTRGSRADRRPVPQGRAAPLTRVACRPVSSARRRPRYPLRSTRRAIRSLQACVATTARIRRSSCGSSKRISFLRLLRRPRGSRGFTRTEGSSLGTQGSVQSWRGYGPWVRVNSECGARSGFPRVAAPRWRSGSRSSRRDRTRRPGVAGRDRG